jgi:hypothetical protein
MFLPVPTGASKYFEYTEPSIGVQELDGKTSVIREQVEPVIYRRVWGMGMCGGGRAGFFMSAFWYGIKPISWEYPKLINVIISLRQVSMRVKNKNENK